MKLPIEPGLYTEIRDEKTFKNHKHEKLSPHYIQKVIETILTKNQDLHQHEELIKSTFCYDTLLTSLEDHFIEHKADEMEFNEIIRKFIKLLVTPFILG